MVDQLFFFQMKYRHVNERMTVKTTCIGCVTFRADVEILLGSLEDEIRTGMKAKATPRLPRRDTSKIDEW